MSRTIDTLKKSSPRDDMLHEHIVATYFSQKTRAKKNKQAVKKLKIPVMAPAFFVAASVLFAASLFLNDYYIKILKERVAAAPVIKILDEGRINKTIMKSFGFRGHAKGHSKFAKNEIAFGNPKKYDWAEFSVDFRFPVNLSSRKLLLSVRGKTGGERMSIVLKDSLNRSYKLKDIYLTSNFRMQSIPLEGIDKYIDLSRITHLRFESGYVGESGMDLPINVTVYIKNMEIVRGA